MRRESSIVWLGCLVLGLGQAQEQEAVYRLDTPEYRIEMNVRFFPPYRGGRLVFYSSTNPGKEVCSANGNFGACFERFVGSLALVTYRFQPRRTNLPAAAKFREVVKLLSKSEGFDEPPYLREQRIVNGVGSDIQAFGYDESAVAVSERAAVRAEASRVRSWRVYRQELFLNGNSEPFGVVEWKHTLNRIEVVRVQASRSQTAHN